MRHFFGALPPQFLHTRSDCGKVLSSKKSRHITPDTRAGFSGLRDDASPESPGKRCLPEIYRASLSQRSDLPFLAHWWRPNFARGSRFPCTRGPLPPGFDALSAALAGVPVRVLLTAVSISRRMACGRLGLGSG